MLLLEEITVAFRGIVAVNGVGFAVASGERCALIGPNGAGKSSLLNVLSGVYRPRAGRITFDGVSRPEMTPALATRLGIARTFQNIALFRGMSVLDNVLTGRNLKMQGTFLGHAFPFGRAAREEARHRAKAEEILEILHIQLHRHTPVGQLPYGLQKRVELGRALAAEPKLLLLDEPMAGMTAGEKRDMSRFIADVNLEYGVAVVLIEHDLGVVMDLCQHLVVLDHGRKIADGTPEEVCGDQNVIDAYLGVAHQSPLSAAL
jgi:branched-chain amino acid transport system ATP-binding protein